jgi:hypothetical protein
MKRISPGCPPPQTLVVPVVTKIGETAEPAIGDDNEKENDPGNGP